MVNLKFSGIIHCLNLPLNHSERDTDPIPHYIVWADPDAAVQHPLVAPVGVGNWQTGLQARSWQRLCLAYSLPPTALYQLLSDSSFRSGTSPLPCCWAWWTTGSSSWSGLTSGCLASGYSAVSAWPRYLLCPQSPAVPPSPPSTWVPILGGGGHLPGFWGSTPHEVGIFNS